MHAYFLLASPYERTIREKTDPASYSGICLERKILFLPPPLFETPTPLKSECFLPHWPSESMGLHKWCWYILPDSSKSVHTDEGRAFLARMTLPRANSIHLLLSSSDSHQDLDGQLASAYFINVKILLTRPLFRSHEPSLSNMGGRGAAHFPSFSTGLADLRILYQSLSNRAAPTSCQPGKSIYH